MRWSSDRGTAEEGEARGRGSPYRRGGPAPPRKDCFLPLVFFLAYFPINHHNTLMDTKCPHCGRIQSVPAEYRGRQVKCPSCSAESPAAAYKPPPPPPPVVIPPEPIPLEKTLPRPSGLGDVLAAFLAMIALFGMIPATHESAAASAGCFVAFILCIIYSRLGMLIDAVNANTLHRQNSKKTKKSS